MFYTLLITLLSIIPQDDPLLIGVWKLQSYGAIEKIRTSPAYLFGDENTRKQIEVQFKLTLDSTVYDFKKDTLFYTSIEGNQVVHRTALWKLENKVLYIDEIKRDYKRQAYLHSLNIDSLVISPIINGKTGDSKMIFSKMTVND